MLKKWIITDLEGNLPTSIEAEALRRALTQERYTQKVWSATSPGDVPEGPLSRCEWGFEDGMPATLIEGLEGSYEALEDLYHVTNEKLNQEIDRRFRAEAELARRPTLIDVIKSTYRMVRG